MSEVSQRSPNLSDTAVWLQTELTGGVRYRSGLTVYDEALTDGRLVGRYWSATGTIKPSRHINEEAEVFASLPAAAFNVRIDDQVLDRDWQWIGAHEQPAGPANARHVVVELAQKARPVVLKVHIGHLHSDLAGCVQALEITARSYAAQGVSGHFDTDIFTGGHRWSGRTSFAWLDRWL